MRNPDLPSSSSTKSHHHHHHHETIRNSKQSSSNKSDHAAVAATRKETNIKKSKADMAGKVPIKMTFMKKVGYFDLFFPI